MLVLRDGVLLHLPPRLPPPGLPAELERERRHPPYHRTIFAAASAYLAQPAVGFPKAHLLAAALREDAPRRPLAVPVLAVPRRERVPAPVLALPTGTCKRTSNNEVFQRFWSIDRCMCALISWLAIELISLLPIAIRDRGWTTTTTTFDRHGVCLVDVEILEEIDGHLLPSVLPPEVADELLVRRVKPDADSRSVSVLWSCHHRLRRRDRSLLITLYYAC